MEKKKEKNIDSKLKNQRLILFLTIAIISIIVIVICVFGFNKIMMNNNDTNNLDEFYGLWNIDGITKYEFDGKGRGKMLLPESNLEYEFTYKINDNKILIDFDSEEAKDYTYKYSIERNVINFEGETPGAGKIQMTREEK